MPTRVMTWPWPEVALILVLALAAPVVAPIVLNQNQYLAHVFADRGKALDADWLIGAVDPYPFFTAVTRVVVDFSGLTGIRFMAWLGTAVLLSGVYGLARVLAPPAHRRGIAVVATILVATTVAPILSAIPIPGVNRFSAFSGFAGQYLGGYLQPSVFGCLLLAAFPLWVLARRAPPGARIKPTAAAISLTALGCMLHPTYLVAVAMGLAAAAIADLWQRDAPPVRWYALIGIGVLAPALAANPSLLAIGGAAVESSEAIQRFAFERIPHHTLWTNWPRSDLLYVLLIVFAAWWLWRSGVDAWLAGWLSAGLALALTAALVVGLTRSATAALLFPWRISVFLVPIAATALAIAMARAIGGALNRSRVGRSAVRNRWIGRSTVAVAALILAATGLLATSRSVPPSISDDAVALVRNSKVTGVGVIPLIEENIRLNARVPIYVDWKSPPYASADLVEWWTRVDHVRAFELEAEAFCSIAWRQRIDWILMPADLTTPTCTNDWATAGETDEWLVLRRP